MDQNSHQLSVSEGDALPTETTSLNFEEVKQTYVEYDAKGGKGNVEMTWKVEEGEE